ncbi:M15 family metallopeptidase [Oscillibacter hominis]|nr:M15 family metallopeptidase [Oscillibacter hominis]
MAENRMMRYEEEIPDREYFVAPRRARRRRRISYRTLLLCAVLFLSGLLLGRALAAEVDIEGGSHLGGTSAGPEPVQAIAPVVDQKKDPEEWQLLLVNKDHLLNEDYKIPEMTKLRNGHSVDSRIYPDLQRMMDDARAAGLQPLICSSYRTWDKQEELFQRKVNYYLQQGCGRQEAEEKASAWVARPGTSEHQAGLAVDIVDVAYQMLDEQQEQTEVQQWLMEHCAEYGFILRYPTDKSDLTGVSYEPWHYRYVGKEAAAEIMEQGLCLEEYLSGQDDVS